ncbi:cubilin [Holotrichia oblita]|uniref:Cubilin n=1 Tax=Holotrichia oblita TaxID=644536 RepID=A0ACB9T1Y8_HOLOL|nr:cubilin [Holotrichia oblita]
MDTTVSPSPIPFRPLQPRYPDGYWRDSAIVFPPPRYRVWLSVVKFYVSGGRGIQKMDQEICRSYLNVWDGQLWTPTNCNGLYCGLKDKSKGKMSPSSLGSRNVTMLARYCKEHIPRTCDHSMLANSTRFPRPCTLSESYLSSGDSLTLELRLADATALRPVKFRVLYEFVDLHQDGEPLADGPCNRKFTILQDGIRKFQAPKDIFLYGRGGAKNISCVYRFEAQKDEKIKIILTDLVIKNRDCRSRISPDTDRYQCYGNTSATVRIFDIPWPDVPGVPRDCFCSTENEAGQHFVFLSTSNIVELRFNVIGMNASDDFTTLFFEGTWKFINCENYPRVMIPAANKYLYVKLHGIILKHLDKQGNETTVSQMKCSTTNRITVHTPLFSAIICPQERESRQHNLVELFSEGWHLNQHKFFPVDRIGIDYLGKELPRTIMVDFMGKEPGTYSVTWLELSRRRKEIPQTESV